MYIHTQVTYIYLILQVFHFYLELEFQVAHAPEILGPAGSFSCKLMVTEGHVTFELQKDNITH